MKKHELSRILRDDLARVDAMMRQKGVFSDTKSGKEYFTGYSYKTLYDWDQYFEALIQLYLEWDDGLIKNGVTIFLDNQEPDGFIHRSVPRHVTTGEGDEHVKPFLTQVVLLDQLYKNDISWINSDYYERLKKYILYWFDKKTGPDGLAVWDSGPHSGMDNQHERMGHWYAGFCAGVDLNCYLVRECGAFAVLARMMGHEKDAILFEELADKTKQAVLTLWDDKDGMFYDKNAKTGESIKIKYSGSFAALWAGVASPQQARRMVDEHLMNPAEFWRGFPVSSYAATEPAYVENKLDGDLGCCWRANTWVPVNYYIFSGLRRYGFEKEAKMLAYATFDMIKTVGDREYFTSDSKKGLGLDPFWGWSALAYFMPLEYELGYNPGEFYIKKSAVTAKSALALLDSAAD